MLGSVETVIGVEGVGRDTVGDVVGPMRRDEVSRTTGTST